MKSDSRMSQPLLLLFNSTDNPYRTSSRSSLGFMRLRSLGRFVVCHQPPVFKVARDSGRFQQISFGLSLGHAHNVSLFRRVLFLCVLENRLCRLIDAVLAIQEMMVFVISQRGVV